MVRDTPSMYESQEQFVLDCCSIVANYQFLRLICLRYVSYRGDKSCAIIHKARYMSGLPVHLEAAARPYPTRQYCQAGRTEKRYKKTS